MELHISTKDSVIIVDIDGDIDGKTAHEIQEQLLPQIHAGSKVLLDMNGVGYMSSAGLRMLLSMYRRTQSHDGRIALAGLSQEISDIMAMTGFINHFTVCDSIEAGIRELNKEGN